MAASAGSMVLKGTSGTIYNVDVYIPDAVATELTFNPTGLASSTSQATYRAPEDCVVIDFTTATAPTAVGGVFRRNSAVIVGGTYRYADRLNTLSKRAVMQIGFKKGDFISALQH